MTPRSDARARWLRTLPALALALAAGGCGLHHHHGGAGGGGGGGMGGGPSDALCKPTVCKPDPANPRVLVTNGHLSVDQEPLRFFKAQGPVTITWRLPTNSAYTFPDNGITLEVAPGTKSQPVKEEFRCARDPKNAQAFVCLNRNSGPGTYKYTVRVLEKERPLEPLDPVIVNQW